MVPRLTVNPADVEFTAVRAQGAGGQNVNKVSSAARLRFDVAASSLPEAIKAKLLAQADRRLSEGGVIVIKAQTHRSLPRNQAEALRRLQGLVDVAAEPQRQRKPTRVPCGAKRRRLDAKAQRGAVKEGRKRVEG